jgi:hypothetical protein
VLQTIIIELGFKPSQVFFIIDDIDEVDYEQKFFLAFSGASRMIDQRASFILVTCQLGVDIDASDMQQLESNSFQSRWHISSL